MFSPLILPMFERFLADFETIWGVFWFRSGSIFATLFGSVWDPFWDNLLAPLGIHFGTTCGFRFGPILELLIGPVGDQF